MLLFGDLYWIGGGPYFRTCMVLGFNHEYLPKYLGHGLQFDALFLTKGSFAAELTSLNPQPPTLNPEP